jgi:hypothetical protein
MSFPTRSDVDELEQQLAALTRKVEQIRKLEEPQAEQQQALARKVDALTREVRELKKLEEPQADEAARLAGRVGTLSRKVTELVKAQEEQPAPVAVPAAQPVKVENAKSGPEVEPAVKKNAPDKKPA